MNLSHRSLRRRPGPAGGAAAPLRRLFCPGAPPAVPWSALKARRPCWPGDAAGGRYELYLLELTGQSGLPAGLAAAMELRQRGRREPLAFAARSAAWAYYAYRADAMQYFAVPGALRGHGRPAGPRGPARIRPPRWPCPRRRGCGVLPFAPDRICGVHPARGPLPPDHRGGGGLPVPAGAFFAAGRPSAGRRAVRPDPTGPTWSTWRRCGFWPRAKCRWPRGPGCPLPPRGGRPPSGRP